MVAELTEGSVGRGGIPDLLRRGTDDENDNGDGEG